MAETEPRIKPPRFLLAWGKKGASAGEFLSPIGIAINSADEILITDWNHRVQKFTAEGQLLGSFKAPTPGLAGIAVDANRRVYVAMWGEESGAKAYASSRIGVFSEDGQEIRQWGKRGTADGEMSAPGGIAVGLDGAIYVADQVNRRVQKFTSDGKFLGKWGAYGTKPGQFDGQAAPRDRFGGPHFLAIDSQGHVFTTEAALGRVQQFTADGKPLRAWGDKGDRPGGFGSYAMGNHGTFGPIGICIDHRDRVWVSSLNNRVQCFSVEGKYLTGIGGTGNEPGQFFRPHAMAVDSRGYLYVVDSSNSRVQKFELPDTEPD